MNFRALAIPAVLLRLISPLPAAEKERRITFPEKAKPAAMNLEKCWEVEGRTNGYQAKILICPAIDFTRLSSKVAENLSLKSLDGYEGVVLLPKLEVAGVVLENEPCIVEEMEDHLSGLTLILGHSTLREFAVRMNFPARQFSLLKPSALPPAGEAEGVGELDVRDSEVALSGTKVTARRGSAALLFQTPEGVALPMVLNGGFQPVPTIPAALLKERLPARVQPEGEIASLNLKMGRLDFTGNFVVSATTPGPAGNAGVLTTANLRKLDLTLDYAGKRFRGLPGEVTWSMEGAGVSLRLGDRGWEVISVTANGRAARAGVTPEDTLVQFAGRPAGRMTASELVALTASDDEPNVMIFSKRDTGKASAPRQVMLKWSLSDEWPDDSLIRGHLRDWAFPKGQVSLEIPLEVDPWYNLLIIPVKINGRTVRCMLDTGASNSILSPEAAARVGMKALRNARMKTISGELAPTLEGVCDTVDMGGVTIRREPWGIASLPATRLEFEGILGLGSLRDFVFRLDWKAKSLTLWRRDSAPRLEGGISLPLTLDDVFVPPSPAPKRYRPVACRVNLPVMDQTFLFTVDSGATLQLSLPARETEKRLPALFAQAGPAGFAGRGMSGTVMEREVRLPWFTFAGETLENLKAGLSPMAHGVLGSGILRHYAVTMDVNQATMHLQSHGTLKESHEGSTAGLSLDWRDGHVIVGRVDPGGPGEKAGMQEGDVMVSMGDRAFKGMTGGEFQALKQMPPGTVLTVKVLRGNVPVEMKLTLGKK